MMDRSLMIRVMHVLLLFSVRTECNPVITPEYIVEEKPLFVPSLEDVAKGLQSGLTDNFENVEVTVVDCPDLTEEPFNLAGKGLSGQQTVAEIGSESYLLPTPKWKKIYDLKDIIRQTKVNPAFVLGAGAGNYKYVGSSSELITNSFVTEQNVHSLTQIAKVVDDKYVAVKMPDEVSTYAFMANFYISQGLPGKVLKVKCTKRIGESDFVTATRDSLRKAFPGQAIGMGGTFLITGSKVRQHVQPDFSKTPITTDAERDAWLKWYDMNPPLVAVGMMITEDPGLTMRPFHFHSISSHGDAGHYHWDLEPLTVEYLAYFNVADRVVRVDRPQ